MERVKYEPTHCEKCLPDVRCIDVPIIGSLRLVIFPEFNIKTLSLEAVDECTYGQRKKISS